MSLIADGRERDAHTLPSVSGRRAALAARNLRLKLMSPPNAVVDRGIHLRAEKPEPPADIAEPPKPPDPLRFRKRAREFKVPQFNKPRSRISAFEIIKVTAAAYGMPLAYLTGRSRRADIARVRQIAMWLSRELTDQSYPQIGRRMGGRDHTTAMHGCGKIDSLLEIDPELADQVRQLKDALLAAQEQADAA